MLDCVSEECERYGLEINRMKTVLLVINPRADVPVPTLTIAGTPVPRVSSAIYLGSTFNEHGTADAEISRRIGLAHVAAQRFMETVFVPREVTIETKKKVFSLVDGVLFYAAETLRSLPSLACRMFYLRHVAGWRRDPDNPILLPSNASILVACATRASSCHRRARPRRVEPAGAPGCARCQGRPSRRGACR
jgi:hypothetical protein